MELSDHQRQRKEYLQKKTESAQKTDKALRRLSMLAGATLICGAFTAIALLVAFFQPVPIWLALTALFALLTIAGGYACPAYSRIVEQAEAEEAALLYVPPFRPDSLFSGETLIRMAQQPAQEAGLPLPTTRAGGETAWEQRLNAVTEQANNQET